MTEQQTLAGFLTERLDEAEEAIKVVRRPYRLYIYDNGVISEPEEYEFPDDRDGEYKKWADGSDYLRNRHQGYALLYDPDQALRDIAAKRALLDRYASAERSAEGASPNDSDVYYAEALEEAVRILATAHSDHKDFREEWAA